MAIDPGRVKALFQGAIELTDPGERRAFLDREIGDDAELRARTEALLAAFEQPHGVLDRPLDAEVEATMDADSGVPQPSSSSTQADGPTVCYRNGDAPPMIDIVIAGRYKIRQEIGEGGMGSDYFAEQTQPVKRQVALKLIKAGMDTRNALARFESERQALALMEHPNIAKVLDAGTTEQGRPFFVMELVKGIPLTDYRDQHQLGLPERPWRSLKYEEVYLKDYRSVAELVSGLTSWFRFCNEERPHQGLKYRTPAQVDQEAGRRSG